MKRYFKYLGCDHLPEYFIKYKIYEMHIIAIEDNFMDAYLNNIKNELYLSNAFEEVYLYEDEYYTLTQLRNQKINEILK